MIILSIAEHIILDGNELMGNIPKEFEDLSNLGMLYDTEPIVLQNADELIYY